MSTMIAGLTALVLYMAASASYAVALTRLPSRELVARRLFQLLALLALLLHAVDLFLHVVDENGFELGVFRVASLVSWFIIAILFSNSLRTPLNSLILFLLPVGSLCIALDKAIASERLIAFSAAPGLELHILISIVAYSLLSVAAVQAILLWLQDRLLRRKADLRLLRHLPPLAEVEHLMFQIISIGFVLLTVGLGVGLLSIEDIARQHLSHKIVFSLIAWLVFAVLLWGRWHLGWRGRLAVRYILSGIILLMLGFFGSSLVLEVILNRV